MVLIRSSFLSKFPSLQKLLALSFFLLSFLSANSPRRNSAPGGGAHSHRRASLSAGPPDRWDPPATASPSRPVSGSSAATAGQKFRGFFRSFGLCFGGASGMEAFDDQETVSRNSSSSAPFRSPYNGSYNTRGKLSGRNVFANFTNDLRLTLKPPPPSLSWF